MSGRISDARRSLVAMCYPEGLAECTIGMWRCLALMSDEVRIELELMVAPTLRQRVERFYMSRDELYRFYNRRT